MTKENNKYKNTVVVEVQEDFNPLQVRTAKSDVKKSRVIYSKGSRHAIRKELLTKLKKKGLKCKEVSVDFGATEKKAADKLRKSRKEN
jgi:hypothetical protein